MAKKIEFHQHPDGWVMVRTPRGDYMDTRENFELDSGRKLPPLPDGADEHVYTQGIRHCFMGDGNIIAGGEREDPELDKIIDSIDGLLRKKKARDDKREAEQAAERAADQERQVREAEAKAKR